MINFVKYFLIGVCGIISLMCFIFTLFFIVSTIAAVRQATLIQFVTLLSFSSVFAIAGNSFMTAAELLGSRIKVGV
jgi:hypothetical protein